MWNAQRTTLRAGAGFLVEMHEDGAPLAYGQALRHWQTNAAFRTMFTALLADLPFAAFRWETPPVTMQSLDRAFEFVALDSPTLERPVEPLVFAEHFADDPQALVLDFANLGNDACMIVPTPTTNDSRYGHLGAFLRNAPDEQHHALWQRVGLCMTRRIGSHPIWLSTAGAGVAWLHVRIDNRPKYYSHAAYRHAPTSAGD